MDTSLIWAITGLALVIIELLTGTFYLLVLGIAAFGAALAAWFGLEFAVQVVIAAIVAAIGVYVVHAYRRRNAAQQMRPIDAGQPASFERWVDRAAGLARVHYRGASWEARFDGEPGAALDAGALVYVREVQGNTLKVSTRSPR
jgi:membrane protein implicated in regulation of membrane protease activity